MSLGVAFHELQLVRVEQHLSTSGRRGVTGNDTRTVSDRRLLLGDVHTDPGQKVLYRPMGFQSALVPHRVTRLLVSYKKLFLSALSRLAVRADPEATVVTGWWPVTQPGFGYSIVIYLH